VSDVDIKIRTCVAKATNRAEDDCPEWCSCGYRENSNS